MSELINTIGALERRESCGNYLKFKPLKYAKLAEYS